MAPVRRPYPAHALPLLDASLDFACGGAAPSLLAAAEQALTERVQLLGAVQADVATLEEATLSIQNQLERSVHGPTLLDQALAYASGVASEVGDQVCRAEAIYQALADEACKAAAAAAARAAAAAEKAREVDVTIVDAWLHRGTDINVAPSPSGDQGGDPLLLDTKGAGIALTSLEGGVRFDLNGDGVKERVSWTAAQGEGGVDTNAWLVRDDRFDGGADGIDNGRELFGDQFGDANGFERLRHFDDNHDGVIDKSDKIYNELELWQDKNHDGVANEGERVGLAAAHVKRIEIGVSGGETTDEHGHRIQHGKAYGTR